MRQELSWVDAPKVPAGELTVGCRGGRTRCRNGHVMKSEERVRGFENSGYVVDDKSKFSNSTSFRPIESHGQYSATQVVIKGVNQKQEQAKGRGAANSRRKVFPTKLITQS